MPTKPVKTTSDITRGFNKAEKSRKCVQTEFPAPAETGVSMEVKEVKLIPQCFGALSAPIS